MKHVSEDDLILYHYGELPDPGPVERHVAACAACAAELGAVRALLSAVDAMPLPERGDDYPARIRMRVEQERLSRPTVLSSTVWFTPRRMVWAAGVALLVVAAFLVGRHDGRTESVPPQVRERILLVAVGDHLERSERLLVELVNAEGTPSLDIADQQDRAKKLVSDNRLYRATANRSGDEEIAALLDQLERLLIEISNGPSSLAYAELADLRRRIEKRGLLLRMRLLGDDARERVQGAPPAGDV